MENKEFKAGDLVKIKFYDIIEEYKAISWFSDHNDFDIITWLIGSEKNFNDLQQSMAVVCERILPSPDNIINAKNDNIKLRDVYVVYSQKNGMHGLVTQLEIEKVG